MVASVGSSLQSGNVSPFQKQTDEQSRNNIGKSGQDGRNTQEAKQSSGAQPASAAKKPETNQQEKNLLKEAASNDEDDRKPRKTRGSNLDITV